MGRGYRSGEEGDIGVGREGISEWGRRGYVMMQL